MESAKAEAGLKSWYEKLQSQFSFLKRKKQKTYIIPSKLGMTYGLVCFVLLLMAMAYGNNLVFIVCFFLTTMGMRVAQVINNTVSSVDLDQFETSDLFAEPGQTVIVTVTNAGKIQLKGLELKIGKMKTGKLFQLEPKETAKIEVPWDIKLRGPTRIPAIELQSSYPGGLFKAWKRFNPKTEVFVFPERKGQKDFPNSADQQNDSLGVLREIRDYKPGDSPKRIHWRSLAKNQQVRTIVHEGHEGKSCHLNWKDLSTKSFEEKLSQLALWVWLAENQDYHWHVQLPHQTFDSRTTPQAYVRIMRELALWKDAE